MDSLFREPAMGLIDMTKIKQKPRQLRAAQSSRPVPVEGAAETVLAPAKNSFGVTPANFSDSLVS
jgi:hypothetical protein